MSSLVTNKTLFIGSIPILHIFELLFTDVFGVPQPFVVSNKNII
jgi:hypothetical protein